MMESGAYTLLGGFYLFLDFKVRQPGSGRSTCCLRSPAGPYGNSDLSPDTPINQIPGNTFHDVVQESTMPTIQYAIAC